MSFTFPPIDIDPVINSFASVEFHMNRVNSTIYSVDLRSTERKQKTHAGMTHEQDDSWTSTHNTDLKWETYSNPHTMLVVSSN